MPWAEDPERLLPFLRELAVELDATRVLAWQERTDLPGWGTIQDWDPAGPLGNLSRPFMMRGPFGHVDVSFPMAAPVPGWNVVTREAALVEMLSRVVGRHSAG